MNIAKVAAASPAPPGPPAPSSRRSFVEVLGETRPAPPAAPTPGASSPAATRAGVDPSPARATWRTLARDVLRTENRIDGILKAAARGQTFTPGELLAMQAEVFRYSQTVEVLSRATDKLVGAVKQTLGTQV